MDVEVKDNSGVVANAMAIAKLKALTTMGITGESFAKLNMNKPMPHADGTKKPYIDTGNLRNSINNSVQGDTAQIGTNVEYAIYIHEGTRSIQPNRFLRDAVAEHQEVYIKIIEDMLKNTHL